MLLGMQLYFPVEYGMLRLSDTHSYDAAAVIPEASAAAVLCLVQERKLKAKPCAPML